VGGALVTLELLLSFHLNLFVNVCVCGVGDDLVAFVLRPLRVCIVLRQIVAVDHRVENAVIVKNLFEAWES